MGIISKDFFLEVFTYLSEGKIIAAFSRVLLPTISLLNVSFEKMHYQLIRFIYRKKSNEVIFDINNRYKMYLDLSDKGISSELCIHKKREFFSTEYFEKIITEDMIIIDIGANIGYYALLESQLAKKGHIYAIEPVPKNFHLLNRNILLNNCQNISTYSLAIGDVEGILEMYVYDKCNWSSFIFNPEGKIIDNIQVPVITLDKFIKLHAVDKPNFIRMDVEGFEYNILKGASRTLQANGHLIICIELHPHLMSKEKSKECIKMIKDNGFKVKSIIRETISCDYWVIGIINKLRSNLNWPMIGYYGNEFDSLECLLEKGHGAMVFFEKDN